MGEEMKLCPFCGGEMEAIRSAYTGQIGWVQHKSEENQAMCPLEFGGLDDNLPDIVAAWNTRISSPSTAGEVEKLREEILNDIAVMMSEFVDNWPHPRRISTALALIAKAMRAALDPPKHRFWGAGEPDCPADIKAANGELWKLRCKICGKDNPRNDICLPVSLTQEAQNVE